MSLDRLLGPLAADPSVLTTFLEQIPAGVVVFDHDGRVLLHNSAFDEIVGVVPPLVQQVALDCGPEARRHPAARTLAGEAVTSEDMSLKGGPRPPRRVRASTLPLRPDGGVVGGVLVLEAQHPPESEAATREILAVVGHDLRNPLAAVRMTAQLLMREGEMTNERRITLAQRLLASSARMDGIVRSVLDYARARAGSLVRLDLERVDLGALARRIADEQSLTHPGRSADVAVKGDPVGRWDPARLEQVVAQLVANAFRHGAETPRPLVSIEGEAADRVELRVENRGPAIPADLLGQIFEPFTIGPRPPGTPRRQIGLGLFLVRQLVLAHGGSVAVASTDEGTRASVSLPRTPPVTAA